MKKIIAAMVLSAGISGLAHSTEWAPAKHSNGVEVFTRATPGSEHRAFKGITRIKAPITSVIALLEDVPEYKSWMYNIKVSNTVGDFTPTDGMIYLVQKAPIITDRDICFEYKVSKVGESVHFEFREKPTGVPVTDYVRVQYFRGMFKLTPKGDHVEVVYEVAADPGGRVPSVVANSMAVDIPYTTLSNMSKKVNFAKYDGKNRFRYN